MKNNELTTSNIIGTEKYINDDDQYPEFLESVKKHFNSMISQGDKLFTTNSEGLYEAYIDGLPEEARQHYTCTACRQFIERFGGLVTISDKGQVNSAL